MDYWKLKRLFSPLFPSLGTIFFFLSRQCVSGNQIRCLFSSFLNAQHESIVYTYTYLLLLKSLSLPDDRNFSNNIMQPLCRHHNLLAKFIYCSFGCVNGILVWPLFSFFPFFSFCRFVVGYFVQSTYTALSKKNENTIMINNDKSILLFA